MVLHFIPYGTNIDAVGIEWRTLDLAQSLIETPRAFASTRREAFWTRFFELSNLAELLCLQESVLLFDDDAIAAERGELLSGPIAEQLRSTVKCIRTLSIDDLQRERVFRRWELLQRSASTVGGWQHLPPDDPGAVLGVKPLLAGLALEELCGVPYFPSLANAGNLMHFGGAWSDATIYSVIVSGYAELRLSEMERRRLLRAHGAGARQLPIPPIMALLLSRVTRVEQIVPVLIDLRAEFEPLRRKLRELRELAVNATAGEWQKEFDGIRREIAKLLREYGELGTRQEVTRFRPDDAAMIKATFGAGDKVDLGGAVDIKRIITALGDTVLEMIRRRQIKPLPSLKRQLDAIPSLTPRIEAIFGVEVHANELAEIERISRHVQETWAFISGRRDPETAVETFFKLPPQSFRKGEEARRHADLFNLETILREYLITLRAASDPKYSRSDQLTDMAFAFLDVGRIERAERLFHEALEADSANGRATYGFAAVAQRRNEPEKARALYEEALTKSADKMLLNDAGTFFATSGEIERALTCFMGAIENGGENPHFLFNLAGTLLNLGRHREAYDAFDRALALASWLGASAYYGRGVAADALGMREQAISDWERAAKCVADDPELAMKIGGALMDVDRYDAAAYALEFARTCDPPNDALMLLASALYLAGKYVAAAEACAELDAIDPDRADVRRQWAFSLYSAGDRTAALERFREAAALDPADVTALTGVAQILFELKEYDEALAAVDRLLAHQQAAEVQAETYYSFGVSCDGMGEFSRAIRCYELALRIGGEDHATFANLAADLMEVGRPAEALPHAERSCELAPNDAINWNNVAAARLELGDDVGAIKALQRVVDLGGGPLGLENAVRALDDLRLTPAPPSSD